MPPFTASMRGCSISHGAQSPPSFANMRLLRSPIGSADMRRLARHVLSAGLAQDSLSGIRTRTPWEYRRYEEVPLFDFDTCCRRIWNDSSAASGHYYCDRRSRGLRRRSKFDETVPTLQARSSLHSGGPREPFQSFKPCQSCKSSVGLWWRLLSRLHACTSIHSPTPLHGAELHPHPEASPGSGR